MPIHSLKTIRHAFLVTAAAASLSACSCAYDANRYNDDQQITEKVKQVLMADPQIDTTQVHVETRQGVVQLSGFVNSSDKENRAVDLTRKVDGVKTVKDSIIVQ